MLERIRTQSEYLLGLTGSLWPLHIKPKPNELFSSWLIRFAHIHGIRSETICTQLFGYRSSIWNRDIDKLGPDAILNKMLSVTGANYQQGLSTFLSSYENYLTLDFKKRGNSKWVLPLGVYHRNRSRSSLMYCPECLKCFTPYYKKLWRLAFITVCTEHRVRLLDRCMKCGAFVMPHRSDHFVKNSIPIESTFIKCCNCGSFLSSSVPMAADKSLLKLQIKLEFALNNGYLPWHDNSNLYSFLLFDGIRQLSLRVMRDLFPKDTGPYIKREIEFVGLDIRYEVMRKIAILLERWPYSFRDYIEDAELSFCYLKNYDSHKIPYWYESEIKKTTKRYSTISSDEAVSIMSYTKKITGKSGVQKARLLSGRDISKYLQRN